MLEMCASTTHEQAAKTERKWKKCGMESHAESFNGQYEREKFQMKLRRRFDHIPQVRTAHFLCLSPAADVKTCKLMS